MNKDIFFRLFKKLFKFYLKSLGLRVIILSTFWVIIALISISYVSLVFYRQASEQNFDRILTANLYSLIASVNVSPAGQLQGQPELGDIRYSDPKSGWYWEVISETKNLKGRLSSPSLGNHVIAIPSDKLVAFDNNFFRFYNSLGVGGQAVRILESDVVLDNKNRVARFRIIGNLDESYAEIKYFSQTLQLFLWIFGIGSVVINILIIFFSLRPLKRIRKTLEDIRKGKAEYISIDLPIEVVPLAKEMNALIENNSRNIYRFRTQVGNLAHSLKTPLSVLTNEVHKMHGVQHDLFVEQTSAMQSQINHYLQRARIAAQRDSIVYHTNVKPVIETLLRVMKKIHPDKTFIIKIKPNEILFNGEKEDLEEMIGNILENAAKWAMKKIILTCSVDSIKSSESLFEIIIEDDGAGLEAEQRIEVLKRGKRLDETKPGSGLGLSIVDDMVVEYGGTLKLLPSTLGGLQVKITLPRS